MWAIRSKYTGDYVRRKGNEYEQAKLSFNILEEIKPVINNPLLEPVKIIIENGILKADDEWQQE